MKLHFILIAGLAAGCALHTVALAQHGGGHYAPSAHRNYDHAVRDAINSNHYRQDAYRDYDRGQSNLGYHGATVPYGAGHPYRDAVRESNHYRNDLRRDYDHGFQGSVIGGNHYQRQNYGHGY